MLAGLSDVLMVATPLPSRPPPRGDGTSQAFRRRLRRARVLDRRTQLPPALLLAARGDGWHKRTFHVLERLAVVGKAAEEAERHALEKAATEPAEREKAAAEAAERKTQEESARQAQEKAATEAAERFAQEEAARQAQEKAATEAAERKKQLVGPLCDLLWSDPDVTSGLLAVEQFNHAYGFELIARAHKLLADCRSGPVDGAAQEKQKILDDSQSCCSTAAPASAGVRSRASRDTAVTPSTRGQHERALDVLLSSVDVPPPMRFQGGLRHLARLLDGGADVEDEFLSLLQAANDASSGWVT